MSEQKLLMLTLYCINKSHVNNKNIGEREPAKE